jgi:tRNA pseudouridine38-40 synthase
MTGDAVAEMSAEELLTYRLDLEYDGTNFQGWQQQPEERTIQACVEAAIEKLFGQHIPVIGAGRTDAGVHAVGQVAHFRTPCTRDTQTILRALNAMLPPDVRIRMVSLALAGFHARYSAKWRGYRYRIVRRPLAIGRQYAWLCEKDLDIARLHQVAQAIMGGCRFQAFAHASEKESHYLSTIYRADWVEDDPFVDFHVEANRFLHGMVRFLVGTFVDVGRGKISIDEFRQIMESQNVRMAGPKAPAQGLTLIAVGYNPWREL